MFAHPQKLTSELEWMLQNAEVTDASLAGALARQYYPALYQVARFNRLTPEQAHNVARRAVLAVVKNRHRYTGEHRLRSWLYRAVLRTSSRPSKGWGRPEFKNTDESQPSEACLPEQLPFVLRYVHELSLPEIAYVTGKRPGSLHTAFNRKRDGDAGENPGVHAPEGLASDAERMLDGPAYLHDDAQALVRQKLDGLLEGEKRQSDREQLQDHLYTCAACRQFAASLDSSEQRLRQQIQAQSSLPSFSDPELDVLAADLEWQAGQKKRLHFSFSIKEISLSLAAIAVILMLVFAGGLSEPNPLPAYLFPSTPEPTAVRQAVQTQVANQRTEAATLTPLQGSSVPETGGAASIQSEAGVGPPAAGRVLLSFTTDTSEIKPDYLGWNHSGPINLAAVLRYWEWTGIRRQVVKAIQPGELDENAMSYEMLTYVQEKTRLGALQRMSGDFAILKRLLDSGYPVIVERGIQREDGWAAVYDIVIGYDEEAPSDTGIRSGEGIPTPYVYLLTYRTGEEVVVRMAYADFEDSWMPFNYAYLLVYPPDEEEHVLALLGPYADEGYSYTAAALRASNEIYLSSSEMDKFFAWFNRGTSLTYLDDFNSAAAAYDEAFAIYASLPEDLKPARMLWYQSRPYWAYFYTGRYQDLRDLATATLEMSEAPSLEESYYWRALAREALGDIPGAITDLSESVRLNPNFVAGSFQLARLNGES